MRLSFVFDFEKREYARANFIIYFDISVILSVVFFLCHFFKSILFLHFFLINSDYNKKHTSHSHLFLFLLCYLVSSFFVFFYTLYKVKSNQQKRFFSPIERKTLIVIFVINKQARAQARAKSKTRTQPS